MCIQRLAIIVVTGMLVSGGWAVAQETAESSLEPYVVEVTVPTLNVRSGPSTNYYAVARINAGARVRVIGQESHWLKIAPPRGCFSLIAARFVDVGDGTEGVVNANNVRVRAGSDLPDYKPYAVQTKLKRGALVRIIGQARERLDDLPDEPLLMIEPPAGVTLYVSDEFVQRVPGDVPAVETEPAAPIERLDADAMAGDALDDPPGFDTVSLGAAPTTVSSGGLAEGEAGESASEVVPVAADEYRRRLEAADARLEEEMAKPILRRDFSALLPAYRELAEQESSAQVQAYAGVRIGQIESANEVLDGLRQMRELREDIRSVRRTALADRANLRPMPVQVGGGFDIEGELRPSALYDSRVGPQRYRLVDPATSPARTLGYVEIPPGSEIDAASFLGRRVGVRVREHILQTGDVNPIAIYVASELVVLDRLADTLEAATPPEETATTSRP